MMRTPRFYSAYDYGAVLGLLLLLLLLLFSLIACSPTSGTERSAITADLLVGPLSKENDELLFYLAYRDVDDNAGIAALSATGLLMPLSASEISIPAPVLSGLNYNNIKRGARIPSLYKPLLNSINTLKKQLPAVYDGVEEIAIINKSRSSYEILITTRFTPLPIVSTVPIAITNLEMALVAATHPEFDTLSDSATHISIRGIVPVIRYDTL